MLEKFNGDEQAYEACVEKRRGKLLFTEDDLGGRGEDLLRSNLEHSMNKEELNRASNLNLADLGAPIAEQVFHKRIVERFKKSNVDIDSKVKDELNTKMAQAIKQGDLPQLRKMINLGAELIRPIDSNKTALELSKESSHPGVKEIVQQAYDQLLVQAIKDMNRGMINTLIARQVTHTSDNRSVVDLMKAYTTARFTDLQAKEFNKMLLNCIKENDPTLVQSFLEAGASLNHNDPHTQSILQESSAAMKEIIHNHEEKHTSRIKIQTIVSELPPEVRGKLNDVKPETSAQASPSSSPGQQKNNGPAID